MSSWYLLTNLARPASRRAQQANLAEVVRLYGLRLWVEQGYKQVKGELGWADFQVRADAAIQRHWHLVCCAFAFCWWAWFHAQVQEETTPAPGDAAVAPASCAPAATDTVGRGENRRRSAARRPPARRPRVLAD